MIFDTVTIKSSIKLDEITWLYEVKLPWIKRQFEGIYYSFNWLSKWYWKYYERFEWKQINNKLIWISTFNNIYIICFLYLDTLITDYFFVKSFNFYNLDKINSNIFIFEDFNGNISYKTSYSSGEFELSIISNKIVITNKVFGSEVYSKDIILNNYVKEVIIPEIEEDKYIFSNFLKEEFNNNEIFLDVADFFIYDDFFIDNWNKNYDSFFEYFKFLNNKVFILSSILKVKINIVKYDDKIWPKFKMNLSIFTEDIWAFEFESFRKLLLSYFPENWVCYLINNSQINDYFWKKYNDFTNIVFNELNIDFNLPDNIFIWDKNFDWFKLDLLKLRHNLFLLKEIYNLKKNKMNLWNNEYIKSLNLLSDISLKTLEKNIINYENKLNKLMNSLIN